MCSKNWGLTPWAVNYFYKAIVRPQLTYGCLIWGHICRFTWAQNKLRSFQRLALKHMGGVYKSSPSLALEVMTYTRPLELQVRLQAAEAYLRTMPHEIIPPQQMWTNIPSHKGHRQWAVEFLTFIGCDFDGTIGTDRLPSRLIWDRNFNIDYN